MIYVVSIEGAAPVAVVEKLEDAKKSANDVAVKIIDDLEEDDGSNSTFFTKWDNSALDVFHRFREPNGYFFSGKTLTKKVSTVNVTAVEFIPAAAAAAESKNPIVKRPQFQISKKLQIDAIKHFIEKSKEQGFKKLRVMDYRISPEIITWARGRKMTAVNEVGGSCLFYRTPLDAQATTYTIAYERFREKMDVYFTADMEVFHE